MGVEIITIGGLLVEIMRKELDKPLTQTADFVGPFPSGDTGIFIDTAARLGGKCAIISNVGDDDFGKCILDNLKSDGVDTSFINVKKGETTGTAFVAYFADGSRKFIYHWANSAAGMLNDNDINLVDLKDVKWAHITGVSISVNDQSKRAVYKLIELLPNEVKVSFDPNIRPEVLSEEDIRQLCKPALDRADIFFPSKGEAKLFAQADNDDDGCKKLAKQGKLVVLKNGEKGCRIFHDDKIIDVPAFKMKEIDPTGAGDSFCAGFLIALNEGKGLYDAGLFANAVGALAVAQKGPMGGAKNKQEVLDLISKK